MDIEERVATAVADLRALADFIEANPVFLGAIEGQRFLHYVLDPDEFPGLVRQLGGHRVKESNSDYFGVTRDFGSIELHVYAQRDAVCERVVVGTETVEVPDPDAPKVTIEREVVEWRCAPILEGAAA